MSADLRDMIAAHLARFRAREVNRPRPDGTPETVHLVLTTRTGAAADHNSFNLCGRRALRKAGVPVTRANMFHALRHACASELLSRGADMVTVAAFLGHTPAVLIRTYAHVLSSGPDRLRELMSCPLFALTHPSRRRVTCPRCSAHPSSAGQ